jgi:hypothetical protein
MEQSTNNNTKQNPYLVTTAVNLTAFSADKLENDLAQLEKAERKATYKPNIAKGIEDPQLYRAMASLRLTNPFKGI